jgi:L-fuculose-phosphate aldolase
MKYESIRCQVLDALREAARLGLIRGTSGNIAVRDFADNVIAISPSARPYDTMTPEEIAIVTLDGTWIDGPYSPSSETPMHTAVYRARPDVGATVHVHALFATVMAMAVDELPPSTPPQAELAPIRTVPFEPPGSEALARRVVETLGAGGTSVLLKNHGCFCCGRDLAQAMSAAVYTEEAAQTACYATLLGAFHPLSREQIAAVRAALDRGRAV